MSNPSLPEAAIPAGVSTTDLLTARWAQGHFRRQQEPPDAVPTPLPAWNRHCRDAGGGIGLAKGWYALIAGATGHGKSLLALNMGAHAIREGTTVAFISLEMSTQQLATRLYAMLTETDVRRIERGPGFDPATAEQVTERVAEIRGQSGARFLTNREPVFALSDVQKLMRRFREDHGAALFIIDYLQLISAADDQEMYRAVTRISRGVREFAARLGVVVVGLSQFNRSTSSNRDAPPLVQGLIGSSSLENDADQVLMLDHTRYAREDHLGRTWAILGKNRHGSTGEIPIEWHYRTLTVREARDDELHDWPGAAP